MSYERMVTKEQQLEAEIAEIKANVDALLSEAERGDGEEHERFGADRRGDELPEELRHREQRLQKIKEAKEALETEARGAESVRRAELEAQGKKPRQPPNGRDPFTPKPSAQRNFTDPESKIMKTSDGSYHQCYSGQAIVDATAQVIVVAELSDQAPDAQQLEPALQQLNENLQAIEEELPEGAVLTADAGYRTSCTRRTDAISGPTSPQVLATQFAAFTTPGGAVCGWWACPRFWLALPSVKPTASGGGGGVERGGWLSA